MAAAERESKDAVVYVTKEEEEARSEEETKLEEEKDPNDQMSAVGPDGEIDWDCPCLSGMTEGPCGDTFKDAFSCFVYSEEEQKGADCMEQFKNLHECMEQNASYYAKDDEEETEETAGDETKSEGKTEDKTEDKTDTTKTEKA
eukprot:m.30828 g.30828  ORF g.30828 m.30828 type:complete len:144 (+) comp16349_c2_seq1:127-558(+)